MDISCDEIEEIHTVTGAAEGASLPDPPVEAGPDALDVPEPPAT